MKKIPLKVLMKNSQNAYRTFRIKLYLNQILLRKNLNPLGGTKNVLKQLKAEKKPGKNI